MKVSVAIRLQKMTLLPKAPPVFRGADRDDLLLRMHFEFERSVNSLRTFLDTNLWVINRESHLAVGLNLVVNSGYIVIDSDCLSFGGHEARGAVCELPAPTLA